MTDRQRVQVVYRDRDDKQTTRVVQVIRVLPLHIVGHCELRGGLRTFNKTRVVSAIDLDTGEILV